MQQIKFCVILGHFLPFHSTPLNNPENQNHEKMKKKKHLGNIIILHICAIKGTNQKKMNIFKKVFLIIFKMLLCGKVSQSEDTSFKKFNLSHLILTFNFNFVMLLHGLNRSLICIQWKSFMLSVISTHSIVMIRSLLDFLKVTSAGTQPEIFWKVAQSLQKCQPPWLDNKEKFGLWNG